jgi:hypothetical protein
VQLLCLSQHVAEEARVSKLLVRTAVRVQRIDTANAVYNVITTELCALYEGEYDGLLLAD